MKKIVTIIGARPQFIKAAVLSRLISEKYVDQIEEVVIHTGQHYDENMSKVFFDEMKIPEPKYNLSMGGGGHGAMTGRMLEGIEKILLDEKPDLVLVYGDTNSTLAGTLAASKLLIPSAHVEAGLRSFNMDMPEEQNRIVSDRLSKLLFCPTEVAVENLKNESISENVYNVGDIMYDASLFYQTLPHELSFEVPENFFLLTLHRQENTDNEERLKNIVHAINSLKDFNGILPIHPRTAKMLDKFQISFEPHIKIIPPIGYLDMIQLESRCDMIVTDSGGVQKEAYFFKKPCITLRDETEWVETVNSGWNTLVGANIEKIKAAMISVKTSDSYPAFYGKGDCGNKIIDIILGNN